jgi:hypothetical protein
MTLRIALLIPNRDGCQYLDSITQRVRNRRRADVDAQLAQLALDPR